MAQPPDSSYPYYQHGQHPQYGQQQPPGSAAMSAQQAAAQAYYNSQEYYNWHQQFQAYQYPNYVQTWQYPAPPPPAEPPTSTTQSAQQQDSYASVVAASAAAYLSNPSYNSVPPPITSPRPQYRAPFSRQHTHTFSKEPSQKMKDAGGGESQWSPELRAYIAKAFDSIESQEEKDQMERILTQKLEYTFRNKVKIEWDKEPIPIPPTRSLGNLKGRGSLNLTRPLSLTNMRGGRGLATGMLGGVRKPAPTVPSLSFKPKKPGSDSDMSINSDEEISSTATTPQKLAFGFNKAGLSGMKFKKRPVSPSSSSDDDSQPKKARVPGKYGIQARLGSKIAADAEDSAGSSAPASPQPAIRGGKKGKGGRGAGNNLSSRFSETSLQQQGVNLSNKKNQRADRFKDHLRSSLSGAGSIAKTTSVIINSFLQNDDDEAAGLVNLNENRIVGSMQELEKQYLRLTRAPLPHEVRPVEVLRKSLEHIKRKWREKSDYQFICEQFKSIRQDLTVQGVEEEFTAYVYEEHADIALEVGDFEEFHQCSSQLMRLHRHSLGTQRKLEFTAYRLLYYLFTSDFLGIGMILASLKPAHRENPFILYALRVREVLATNNYVRFFRILRNKSDAPGKCFEVLKWSIGRERKEAIKRIFHSWVPQLHSYFYHLPLLMLLIPEAPTLPK
ncbi:Leukocyte receptor cluster (LRC) member 8 [Cichlidogyrus casuarinus]|uniref:Leukocyte receptor cluster (LRC) member 8 n=1 Tax=Cichlidogyrus casuarinus TaxID=1844966 RepID=A0ABD2QAX0_9PLAT